MKVKNISSERIDLLVGPSFEIHDSAPMDWGLYWGPTTLDESAEPREANTHFLISLDKGEEIDSRADVSQLGWDICISSTWPAKDLFDLLDPGEYSLGLSMQVKNAKQMWIKSDIVPFRIVKSGTESEDERRTDGSSAPIN